MLNPFTKLFRRSETEKFIDMVKKKNLSFLERKALDELIQAVKYTNALEGDLIEAGCAGGGSAICIGHAKSKEKKLLVYDVFGMIPEPGEKDGITAKKRYKLIKDGKARGIGGDIYYGYQQNLKESVETNMKELLGIRKLEDKNISLIEGLFEDTLIVNNPVCFAHIDCDWYDSVYLCLSRIVPRLVKGGVLILDDYGHWEGAKLAVDDYFADKRGLYDFNKKRRLHITRK